MAMLFGMLAKGDVLYYNVDKQKCRGIVACSSKLRKMFCCMRRIV